MIILHMTNLSAGVSMIDLIVQYIWMTLMHSGWSTTRKTLSLTVIEDSFPRVSNVAPQYQLILPHNINLMHQERNVAENIISMRFDVTSFSKDNMNARKDIAALCII
jgi:hypothetical protein